MNTTIIADFGSCHLGKIDTAKELIKIAADSGVDIVKGQLFRDLPNNIELPYEWVLELKGHADDIGIELMFSVFDLEAYEMATAHCRSIKFAYSHRNDSLIHSAIINMADVYVTSGIMDDINPATTNLWTHTHNGVPVYPVVTDINFTGTFERFDGFSSHCLDWGQNVEAVSYGAKVIECHFCQGVEPVPDAKFAYKPKDLGNMVREIRLVE